MSKNLYIVLHDFTEIGDTALEYALHIAEHVHTDIELLHVVNSSSKEEGAKAKRSPKVVPIGMNTLETGASKMKKLKVPKPVSFLLKNRSKPTINDEHRISSANMFLKEKKETTSMALGE